MAGVTFLGLWSVGQVVQPRVGQRGDSDLAGMDLAGVGTCPRQELKQRALAAAREPDDSDTHPSLFSLFAQGRSAASAGPTGWSARVRRCLGRSERGDQGLFKLVSRASSRASSSCERSGLELEMPESDPIKRIDDLLGDVGDGWVSGPGRSRTCGRGRRTRSGSPPECAPARRRRASGPAAGKRGFRP